MGLRRSCASSCGSGQYADNIGSSENDTKSDTSTALAIVWENSWARRLIDAIVGSGGRLVAHDRLDAEAVNELLAEFAES